VLPVAACAALAPLNLPRHPPTPCFQASKGMAAPKPAARKAAGRKASLAVLFCPRLLHQPSPPPLFPFPWRLPGPEAGLSAERPRLRRRHRQDSRTHQRRAAPRAPPRAHNKAHHRTAVTPCAERNVIPRPRAEAQHGSPQSLHRPCAELVRRALAWPQPQLGVSGGAARTPAKRSTCQHPAQTRPAPLVTSASLVTCFEAARLQQGVPSWWGAGATA
jgi:hypothetical protein